MEFRSEYTVTKLVRETPDGGTMTWAPADDPRDPYGPTWRVERTTQIKKRGRDWTQMRGSSEVVVVDSRTGAEAILQAIQDGRLWEYPEPQDVRAVVQAAYAYAARDA